jgi:hypothetical protein
MVGGDSVNPNGFIIEKSKVNYQDQDFATNIHLLVKCHPA